MASRILYRAHRPQWAHMPLSGAGAASTGGRWNRPGQAALYLSSDPHTAELEPQREPVLVPTGVAEGDRFKLLEPVTKVTYIVDNPRLFDTRVEDRLAQYDLNPGALLMSWERHVFERTDAPTWCAMDRMLADGFDGASYASRVTGLENVVLWRWNATGGPEIRVHDPNRRLPRDAASWR